MDIVWKLEDIYRNLFEILSQSKVVLVLLVTLPWATFIV
jgi:hypothetical protein